MSFGSIIPNVRSSSFLSIIDDILLINCQQLIPFSQIIFENAIRQKIHNVATFLFQLITLERNRSGLPILYKNPTTAILFVTFGSVLRCTMCNSMSYLLHCKFVTSSSHLVTRLICILGGHQINYESRKEL